MNEYKIAWRGLGQGVHNFDFTLTSRFFDAFEYTQGTEGNVTAHVQLTKSSCLMEVKITIEGIVKAICDRCLCPLDLPIKGETSFYAKQGDSSDSDDDQFIVLSQSDDFLELSQYIYELYILNYPIRTVHEDGQCDQEMQDLLERYVIDETEKPTDPRWDGLKKLINN